MYDKSSLSSKKLQEWGFMSSTTNIAYTCLIEMLIVNNKHVNMRTFIGIFLQIKLKLWIYWSELICFLPWSGRRSGRPPANTSNPSMKMLRAITMWYEFQIEKYKEFLAWDIVKMPTRSFFGSYGTDSISELIVRNVKKNVDTFGEVCEQVLRDGSRLLDIAT